ncbi:MAG TPA: carboxypeptidase-like regulatory domain-containing protein [Thermoanaerobaculia bacterium]|jgi:hypothetical protein
MRTLLVSSALLLALSASAGTLNVEVSRNGFTGPIEVALSRRVEGRPPHWAVIRTLAAGKSTVTFPALDEGLYTVRASGPEPLQRLSAKANVGATASTVRLTIPKTATALSVTLAGQPLPRAVVVLTHEELRWDTRVETDQKGRFAGALWEPGAYSAGVRRDLTSAPHHISTVTLSTEPLAIVVPDRHVTGRVVTDDGKPVADALVILRSETVDSTLTVRTKSAPDGRFEFFGVRDAAHTLSARAPSYLNSDTASFELRGAAGEHAADLVLTKGQPRTVRVIDARDAAIAGATLITSCEGHMKSTTVTDAEGRANVAVPAAASCAIFALPKEGSIAVGRFEGPRELLIRVPDGSSSLRLALKSEAGVAFPDLNLLLRIDGMVVPPEIARAFGSRGFSLMTNQEGSISLPRIPPGTYEFWPYRTNSEGQMIYEVAADIAAPISVRVLTGENNATVRFKAR